MKVLAAKIKLRLQALVVDYAQEIQAGLAQTTPVDTGQAVSNWHLSLGAPYQSFVPPYVPGKWGSTRTQNVNATVMQALELHPTAYHSGMALFIVNNAPYIEQLNAGRSKWASAYYIEGSMRESIKQSSLLNFNLW